MKDSVRHSSILIGVALMLVAGVILYMTLSGPRPYVTDDTVTVPHTEYMYETEPNSTMQHNTSMQVNLNTATVDDLVSIDGIGEKTAIQIISYRDEIGGYTSISQIKNIKGIGDAKFEQLAPFLTV